MSQLRLRIGERLADGQINARVYELHSQYTQRLVQGLIDRAIALLQSDRPEPLTLLLPDRSKLVLSAQELDRCETIAIMDQNIAAPPPLHDEGEGLEDL